MSIAAYPIQSAFPSYSEFEPAGGQNNGSAFVLRGQSGGAPTILRPRVTPIQEASMSVSIRATVNTLYNNASDNGYEGLAPTLELLRVNTNGIQVLWNNGLFSQYRPDLWIADKRDWHTLTWIQEIPQIGADLLNVGLVNKCTSGWAKVANLSLTNHYFRHYNSITPGNSNSLTLTSTNDAWPTYYWGGTFFPYKQRWVAYMDTISSVTILQGEEVEVSASGALGCVSDSDTDVPIKLCVAVKLRLEQGTYIYKTVAVINSETAVIEETDFIQSISFRAEKNFTQAEVLVYVTTAYGRVHSTTAIHSGLSVEITSRGNLTSSSL